VRNAGEASGQNADNIGDRKKRVDDCRPYPPEEADEPKVIHVRSGMFEAIDLDEVRRAIEFRAVFLEPRPIVQADDMDVEPPAIQAGDEFQELVFRSREIRPYPVYHQHERNRLGRFARDLRNVGVPDSRETKILQQPAQSPFCLVQIHVMPEAIEPGNLDAR